MSLLQSLRFSLAHLNVGQLPQVCERYICDKQILFDANISDGCVGIGAPLAQLGSSRRRRRGMSCPNEAVAARATQNPAASPDRDGMTERPLQAGAVVILFAIWSSFNFDLFDQDTPCLAPCYPLILGICTRVQSLFCSYNFHGGAIGIMLQKSRDM